MSHPLFRTLISEMVGDYLNESYEDDLMESIFEEVSDETWEAIEEAILNELSPKTLSSYVKKANRSANKSFSNAIKQQSRANKGAAGADEKRAQYSKDFDKRATGIDRANKRLGTK